VTTRAVVALKRDRWSPVWSGGVAEAGVPETKEVVADGSVPGGYFFVWTDVPAEVLDATSVLAWYRSRWQIELDFKRMKSILGLGDLPKRREDSCRAWLHGKLLVALLLERLLDRVEHFSPGATSWHSRRSPLA